MRYIVGAFIAGLLVGCGPAEFNDNPDSVSGEAELASTEAALTGYHWEKVYQGSPAISTTTCSMTAGSPCTTPGETCTYLSVRYTNGTGYSNSYVCRQTRGTYGPMVVRTGICPSNTSHTICPSNNPQGQPCSDNFFGSCIWSCYSSMSGPMQMAECR